MLQSLEIQSSFNDYINQGSQVTVTVLKEFVSAQQILARKFSCTKKHPLLKVNQATKCKTEKLKRKFKQPLLPLIAQKSPLCTLKRSGQKSYT